jgi:hypothetical protein
MAITTYAEVRGAIASWLARGDFTSANTADFITLFESTANRKLRTRQMLDSETIATTSGVGTLPTDYLAWETVRWDADFPVTLTYQNIDWLESAYPSTVSDVPGYFTILGDTIKTFPQDDSSDLALRYFQKIPALSDANTSNWLLAAHPDVYLFGSLVEACAFVQDERALLWKARRDEIFQEIAKLSDKSQAPAEIRVWGNVV